MAAEIKFGTDGWRGVIADDYTFANVRRVAGAIASYVLKKENPKRGIVVGYDTRFGSRRFAEAAAEMIALAGIPVKLANDYTPTPALSYAVKNLGTAGGVMITSSHNPWSWNGVKFKATYGGSATPGIIRQIEDEVRAGAMPKGSPADIEEVDFKPPYIEAISRFIDLDKIAKANFKFAIDCMYGAGRNVLSGIFKQRGIEHVQIRSEVNPLFPGINPEPIEPHVRMLQETVVHEKCHAGLVANIMADEGKSLGQLVAYLQKEYGPHYYARRDLHVANEIKEAALARAAGKEFQMLGRYRILSKEDLDGIKLFLDAPTNGNGAVAWLLLRSPGTEPLLRLYSEASSPELVQELLEEAVAFVDAKVPVAAH